MLRLITLCYLLGLSYIFKSTDNSKKCFHYFFNKHIIIIFALCTSKNCDFNIWSSECLGKFQRENSNLNSMKAVLKRNSCLNVISQKFKEPLSGKYWDFYLIKVWLFGCLVCQPALALICPLSYGQEVGNVFFSHDE